MLNQDNKYFNRYLTYLDQGGNNIWWSTNSISNITTIAELINTGTGIDSACIEEDCIPICSEIIENEQQTIEVLSKPQQLIYPTFIKEFNKLTIRLNNLVLIDQPNYIEDGCVDSECTEEFGIWTKVIKTQVSVQVEDETYYFIKANPDNYSFSYIYNISLIHQETGEEIVIDKNKGLLSPIISIEYDIPDGFNIAISITKFNIEEIIATYKFIDNPLLLRSNFNTNLTWQPLLNNTEEVLLSIIYILNTNLEIEDNNKLILYKDKQEVLINTLIQSVISITTNNSISYSYIKNITKPLSYNELTSNDNKNIANLKLNPAIYETINYDIQEPNDIVIILVLLALIQLKVDINNTLLNDYITRVIELQTYSLREEVLKLIVLTEAYKLTKDIYVLSIATSTLNQINKRYKLEGNTYIESLNNPNITLESKIYGDILETYVYNKEVNIQSYITSQFNYLNDITDSLYLINSPTVITDNIIYITLLNLFNIRLPYTSLINTNILQELTNISNTSFIETNILESINLFKQDVFNTIKLSIPTDFGWLSDNTPVQDLIIESISKPLIDLYLHSAYIKDDIVQKEALVRDYIGIINNKEELLLKTFTTDITSIRSSLWPGKYSNSIDLEIKGFYDEFTLQEIDNIKSLGIETSLVSGIDLPNIDNFDLCFNITKLEDFRCQVDINGQLILLTDGQCDLAPPELSILLQENDDPITQETSIEDYILV